MSTFVQTAFAALKEAASHPACQAFLSKITPEKLGSITAVTSDPTTATAAITVVLIIACYLGQTFLKYWSWVDRLWSVMPVGIAVIYAGFSQFDARVSLMTALIGLWGARLTRNFARKGGYAEEEDYRWAILRAWFRAHDPFHPLFEQLFSIFFVSAYQLALIWGFTALPLFAAYNAAGTPLGLPDFLLAAVFLTALYSEHLTDEAQWSFQSKKYSMSPAQRKAAGGDYARGFCTTGPFAVSRHLNFFCENVMWWTLCAFSWCVGLPWLNFTFTCAFLLTLLFQGSTTMTEAITAGKYPAYRAYQQTTSRLMPWIPGPSLDSPEGIALVKAVGKAD